jgi:hypothetical protein
MTFTNLSDAFPQNQDLYTTSLGKNPFNEGQNFIQCCLLAVSQSFIIRDGKVISNPDTSQDDIGLSPSELDASQFPCGATYNGNTAGAASAIVQGIATELVEFVQGVKSFLVNITSLINTTIWVAVVFSATDYGDVRDCHPRHSKCEGVRSVVIANNTTITDDRKELFYLNQTPDAFPSVVLLIFRCG